MVEFPIYYSFDVLKTNIENILKDLENDTGPLVDVLCSIGKGFDALKAANERAYKFFSYTVRCKSF